MIYNTLDTFITELQNTTIVVSYPDADKAFEGDLSEDECKMPGLGFTDGFITSLKRKVTAFEECKEECRNTLGKDSFFFYSKLLILLTLFMLNEKPFSDKILGRFKQ